MSYHRFLSLNILEQYYKIMGEVSEDVTHKIQAGWLKWRKDTGSYL